MKEMTLDENIIDAIKKYDDVTYPVSTTIQQIKQAIEKEFDRIIDMSESSHPDCWFQKDIRRILR